MIDQKYELERKEKALKLKALLEKAMLKKQRNVSLTSELQLIDQRQNLNQQTLSEVRKR